MKQATFKSKLVIGLLAILFLSFRAYGTKPPVPLTGDQTYVFVGAISQTQEVELTIVRHSNGTVDVYKVQRAINESYVSVFCPDLEWTFESGTALITVPSSPAFVFIPFENTTDMSAPVGATYCIRCDCCSSGMGANGGGTCSVFSQGTAGASCTNVGCMPPDDGTATCGSSPCTGSGLPKTGGVLLQADINNVTIHQ